MSPSAKGAGAKQPFCGQMAKTMKLLREIKGMGLREHAKRLNMNPATLHRIENGRGCDIATLVHIHQATGVKYETLLGDV